MGMGQGFMCGAQALFAGVAQGRGFAVAPKGRFECACAHTGVVGNFTQRQGAVEMGMDVFLGLAHAAVVAAVGASGAVVLREQQREGRQQEFLHRCAGRPMRQPQAAEAVEVVRDVHGRLPPGRHIGVLPRAAQRKGTVRRGAVVQIPAVHQLAGGAQQHHLAVFAPVHAALPARLQDAEHVRVHDDVLRRAFQPTPAAQGHLHHVEVAALARVDDHVGAI